MNKTEIEVAGQTYRIGKLNAIQQFHVSRRLGPVMAAVGISLQSLSAGMLADLSDFSAIIGPATEVMSKMTDEETNYIIFTCLGCVGRQEEARWAPVVQGSNFMYQDIDMPVMIRLVVAVLQDNIGNFLQGLSGESSLQGS